LRIAAAVLRGAGAAIQVREVELAAPGPGEVLVRLKAGGVGHTDLNVADVLVRTALLRALTS